MSEANLKLGAVVNLEDLKVSFDEAGATVHTSIGEMVSAFRGLSDTSSGVSKQVGADATGMAAVVSPAYQRIAEATVAYRQAQAAVRAASRDTIALAAGEAGAVDRLTLALQRQAAADAELSAAKKATAVATTESAGAMGLFAEAMGPLLEGALIAGYVEHLKDATLETSHLADASGLAVIDLVELKDAMDSLGVSTERLPQQITHLAQQIADAANGSKGAQHEFHQLGVETDGWAGKLPSTLDVLLKMSDHLKQGTASTNDLAAASKLLGRNSFETVAFLKQGSDAIREQMKAHEDHAKAVNDSVQAAKQLQQTEAQLSQQLQTTMLPVFQAVVIVVQSVAAAIQYLGAIFDSIGRVMLAMALNIITSFKGIATVVGDVLAGNFAKAAVDGKAAAGEIQDQFKLAAGDIAKSFTDAQAAVDKIFAIPAQPEGGRGNDSDIIADAGKTAKAKADAVKDGRREEYQAVVDEIDLEIAEDRKNLALKIQLLQQKADAAKRIYGEESHEYRRAMIDVQEAQDQANDAIARKLQEQQTKFREFHLAVEQDARAASAGRLEDQKSELDFELSIGKISQQDKLSALRNYEAQAYAEEKASLDRQLALYQDDEKGYEETKKQMAKLDADYRREQLQLDRQSVEQRLQPWKNFFSEVGQNWKTSLNGYMQGSQSFTDATKKMWNGMALAAIESLESIAQAWVTKHVFMAAISKIFHLSKIKDDVASATSEAATAGTTNTALATSAANLGAANAYAFWAWNPPIAAAMAAAALSVGLGFAAASGAAAVAGGAGAAGAGAGGAAVGFAAQGALLGEDQLVFAHREEMILPPHISRPLQASLASGDGIGGGGGQTIHLTYAPQVSSVDGAHAHSVIERHAAQIGAIAAKTVRRQMKKLI